MTWLTATGRLAKQLRVLVTTPQELAPEDAGLPVAGYVAILELVRRVHGELEASAEELDHDGQSAEPSPTWQQLFATSVAASVPGELRRVATARAAEPARSAPGELWQAVARTASHAEAEWEVSTRESRPTGSGIDAAVADLASLQWAAGTAFVNANQGKVTDTSTLAVVTAHAQQTATIARRALRGFVTADDHVGYRDLREHEPAVPIDDAGPDNLARAMRRLSHLIATADLMGPRVAAQTAAMHRITTTHISDAARRAGRDQRHRGLVNVGRMLHRHAAALEISPPHVETLRTLDPIDDIQVAVLRQATAVARAAEQAAIADSVPVGQLLAAVSEVPDVTRRLAAQARGNIVGGQWLRSTTGPARTARRSASATSTGPTAPGWSRTSAFDDIPLATVLDRAANQAIVLGRELPRATHTRAIDVLSDLAARPNRNGITHPDIDARP